MRMRIASLIAKLALAGALLVFSIALVSISNNTFKVKLTDRDRASLDAHTQALNQIETRFERIEMKLDTLNGNLRDLQTGLDKGKEAANDLSHTINTRFEELRIEINTIRRQFGGEGR